MNEQFGVKGYEQDGEKYLVLWTSNAFKDRERETFKTKAWEDYVARRDARGEGYDRVWFWHVKGTDFADVVWEDMVGRILVDVARLDHTPFADKMYHAITHPEEFPDIAPLGWGTSHGYAYHIGDKQNGVYDFVEKFESTVLPYHRASNLWGGIKEVVDMAVTKEKKDALAKLVGQQLAEETLEDAEKATSVLEQAGISFKEGPPEKAPVEEEPEDADGEDEEADEEEPEDEEDGEDEGLYELEVTDDLVKEIAAKVDISASVKETMAESMKGMKEAIVAELTPVIVSAVNEAIKAQQVGQKESNEEIVKAALSGKISLKPWSASKADGTVAPDSMVQDAKEAASGKKKRDVVADVVSNMLAGK